MAEETENKSVASVLEVNYAELAVTQQKQVAELEARVKESPSEALNDELDRQLDKLRFFENAANGDPRTRAAQAAAAAKKAVIGKAVVQPLS